MTTVFVTQAHIDLGTPGDPDGCPIALALRDYFRTEDVDVGDAIIWVNDVAYRIPDNVIDWIYALDCYEDVAPIAFDLEPLH